jgi:hypothetical protein
VRVDTYDEEALSSVQIIHHQPLVRVLVCGMVTENANMLKEVEWKSNDDLYQNEIIKARFVNVLRSRRHISLVMS